MRFLVGSSAMRLTKVSDAPPDRVEPIVQGIVSARPLDHDLVAIAQSRLHCLADNG